MFPNVQNSKLLMDANSETKCAYKHTAKLADAKKNSASIALHFPSNEERQMQLRKFRSNAKTQYRVRLHHLANKYVLKRDKSGRDLHRLELRICEFETLQHSITIHRMDFEHGKQGKQLRFYTSVGRVRGSYSENRHLFFKPSPASNASSPCIPTWKGRASLQLMSKK